MDINALSQSVTAIIEVKVAPSRGQGFDRIAERIYRFDEVKAVYLISSRECDLSIVIEGKTMMDIAHFVSDKLASLDSILSTATHFILKKYKENGQILQEEDIPDERMIISP